jgi:hypothetical protein
MVVVAWAPLAGRVELVVSACSHLDRSGDSVMPIPCARRVETLTGSLAAAEPVLEADEIAHRYGRGEDTRVPRSGP